GRNRNTDIESEPTFADLRLPGDDRQTFRNQIGDAVGHRRECFLLQLSGGVDMIAPSLFSVRFTREGHNVRPRIEPNAAARICCTASSPIDSVRPDHCAALYAISTASMNASSLAWTRSASSEARIANSSSCRAVKLLARTAVMRSS